MTDKTEIVTIRLIKCLFNSVHREYTMSNEVLGWFVRLRFPSDTEFSINYDSPLETEQCFPIFKKKPS